MIWSPYVAAFVIALLSAQGLKYVVNLIIKRDFHVLKQAYLSGGMPSAHSASVVAVLTVVAGTEGLASPLFGVATLFGAIVLYDAVMVRRSSGEQGEALRHLIAKIDQAAAARLFVAKGHTLWEIVVGGLLGAAIGLTILVLS